MGFHSLWEETKCWKAGDDLDLYYSLKLAELTFIIANAVEKNYTELSQDKCKSLS